MREGQEDQREERCHSFSTETLFHFLCFECARWWTIGDWKRHEELSCPHCGVRAKVKEGEMETLKFQTSSVLVATFGSKGVWDPFHHEEPPTHKIIGSIDIEQLTNGPSSP